MNPVEAVVVEHQENTKASLRDKAEEDGIKTKHEASPATKKDWSPEVNCICVSNMTITKSTERENSLFTVFQAISVRAARSYNAPIVRICTKRVDALPHAESATTAKALAISLPSARRNVR